MIPKNSSVVVKRVPATRAKTLRIEAEAPDLLPFSPVAGPRVRTHAHVLCREMRGTSWHA